jgi:hypothetical protein
MNEKHKAVVFSSSFRVARSSFISLASGAPSAASLSSVVE